MVVAWAMLTDEQRATCDRFRDALADELKEDRDHRSWLGTLVFRCDRCCSCTCENVHAARSRDCIYGFLLADQACLLRYLRARDWHLQKAETMIRATLQWRREYKPHEIKFDEVKDVLVSGFLLSCFGRPPHRNCEGSRFTVSQWLGFRRPAGYICETRRLQSLLCWYYLLLFLISFYPSLIADQRLKALVYTLENATQHMKNGVEKICWIMDFSGRRMLCGCHS